MTASSAAAQLFRRRPVAASVEDAGHDTTHAGGLARRMGPALRAFLAGRR